MSVGSDAFSKSQLMRLSPNLRSILAISALDLVVNTFSVSPPYLFVTSWISPNTKRFPSVKKYLPLIKSSNNTPALVSVSILPLSYKSLIVAVASSLYLRKAITSVTTSAPVSSNILFGKRYAPKNSAFRLAFWRNLILDCCFPDTILVGVTNTANPPCLSFSSERKIK